MFPIGRMIANPKATILPTEEKHVDYIFTAPHCGDKRETHTVREWLGVFDIPLNDEFFLKWSGVLTEVSVSLQKLEKKFSEKSMNIIWNLVFNSLYMQYETDKEFLPQFEEVSRILLESMNTLCEKAKEGGLM